MAHPSVPTDSVTLWMPYVPALGKIIYIMHFLESVDTVGSSNSFSVAAVSTLCLILLPKAIGQVKGKNSESMCVCMFAYIFVHICMFVCMYVYQSMYMYVYVGVCLCWRQGAERKRRHDWSFH